MLLNIAQKIVFFLIQYKLFHCLISVTVLGKEGIQKGAAHAKLVWNINSCGSKRVEYIPTFQCLTYI